MKGRTHKIFSIQLFCAAVCVLLGLHVLSCDNDDKSAAYKGDVCPPPATELLPNSSMKENASNYNESVGR